MEKKIVFCGQDHITETKQELTTRTALERNTPSKSFET